MGGVYFCFFFVPVVLLNFKIIDLTSNVKLQAFYECRSESMNLILDDSIHSNLTLTIHSLLSYSDYSLRLILL